jgi:hypothetical protein
MAWRVLPRRDESWPVESGLGETGRGSPMTHEQWQAQVVELAHILGWGHLHVRRSIGKGRKWVTATNRIGWPDLFLWSPRHGFAAIELKVGRDKATPEQDAVLAELAVAGAVTLVAYPEDLDRVKAVLEGRAQMH